MHILIYLHVYVYINIYLYIYIYIYIYFGFEWTLESYMVINENAIYDPALLKIMAIKNN